MLVAQHQPDADGSRLAGASESTSTADRDVTYERTVVRDRDVQGESTKARYRDRPTERTESNDRDVNIESTVSSDRTEMECEHRVKRVRQCR